MGVLSWVYLFVFANQRAHESREQCDPRAVSKHEKSVKLLRVLLFLCGSDSEGC